MLAYVAKWTFVRCIKLGILIRGVMRIIRWVLNATTRVLLRRRQEDQGWYTYVIASTQEAEVGGAHIQAHHGQLHEILPQNEKQKRLEFRSQVSQKFSRVEDDWVTGAPYSMVGPTAQVGS